MGQCIDHAVRLQDSLSHGAVVGDGPGDGAVHPLGTLVAQGVRRDGGQYGGDLVVDLGSLRQPPVDAV